MVSIQDDEYGAFVISFLDSLTDADLADSNPDSVPESFAHVGRRFFDEYRTHFGSYPREPIGIQTMWSTCKQYGAGEGTRKSELVKYLGGALLILGDEELKLYEEEDYENVLNGLLKACGEDANQSMARVNVSSVRRALDFMISRKANSIIFTPEKITIVGEGAEYSPEDFGVAGEEPFSLLSDPIDYQHFAYLLGIMGALENPEEGGNGEFEIPGVGKYHLDIRDSNQGKVIEIRLEKNFSSDV